MARINNRNKYPQNDPVSINDYLIGTDAETGFTKTFSVASLLGLGGDTPPVGDTAASLSGNVITFPDGQTVVIPVNTDTDTFATINSGIITFANGDVVDLGTIDTDTFATINNDLLTLADGTTYDLTDDSATLAGNVITFPTGQTITIPNSSTDDQVASEVPVQTNNFNGNLQSTDDTLQKVADRLDDLTLGSNDNYSIGITGSTINLLNNGNIVSSGTLSSIVSNISNTIAGHTIATHTNGSGIQIDIAETVTTLNINANVLEYTREDGSIDTVDLNLYLDDSNLARITSGVLNEDTGVATFTRDDNTTFTLDLSGLLDMNPIVYVYKVGQGVQTDPHLHLAYLRLSHMKDLVENEVSSVTITSTEIEGHQHDIEIGYNKFENKLEVLNITALTDHNHEACIVGINESVGGGNVTVSNGLSIDGATGNVELGGSITKNTQLDIEDGNSFSIRGLNSSDNVESLIDLSTVTGGVNITSDRDLTLRSINTRTSLSANTSAEIAINNLDGNTPNRRFTLNKLFISTGDVDGSFIQDRPVFRTDVPLVYNPSLASGSVLTFSNDNEIPNKKYVDDEIAANLKAVTANNERIELVSCVFRNVGGTWQILNDANHSPTDNISGITQDTTNQITINFNGFFDKVVGSSVTLDERYAEEGCFVGQSQRLDSTEIKLYRLLNGNVVPFNHTQSGLPLSNLWFSAYLIR